MQTRQKVEQVKAYFNAVENPHNSLHEAVKDTKGYSLGLAKQTTQYCKYASWELKPTKEWEKYPNRLRRLCETLLPENLGKHYRKWPAGKKRVRDQNTKTANRKIPHSVHWWLSHQRPVRVGLHCQARCNYHPWRQCSLYGLNLQLDIGGGSSHPWPPLDCLKRGQSLGFWIVLENNYDNNKKRYALGIQWIVHKKQNIILIIHSYDQQRFEWCQPSHIQSRR